MLREILDSVSRAIDPGSAFDQADAGACFNELKRQLSATGDELPLDDDKFDDSFGLCFRVHPKTLPPESRAAFKTALGRASLVEWSAFHRRWRASGKSMPDYLRKLEPQPRTIALRRIDDDTQPFPLEFCLRFLKNLFVEKDASIMEGLDVLRTADLVSALDLFEPLLANYENYVAKGNENEQDPKRLREDAACVRDLATKAFRTVTATEHKVLAVKVAMGAMVVVGGLGGCTTYVYTHLKQQVEKMLGDEGVKRVLDDRSWMPRRREEALVREILLLVIREHAFAVTHGFRNLEDPPMLKNIFDILDDAAAAAFFFTDDDLPSLGRRGLMMWLSRYFEPAQAKVLAGIKEEECLISSSCNIGDQGAWRLAEALGKNTALRRIGLGRNGISDDGAAAIAASLKKNILLKELYLHSNNISDDGAAELATVSTLDCLGLQKNLIGDAGAVAFAEHLRCSNLRKLLLAHNRIGDEGARALATALGSSNCKLELLNLQGNPISESAQANLLRKAASLSLRILF
ncbi:hypothetical protein CTAYLR_005768 [Chrysophaeum taylorii]|uniref:Uncharacterized protein n=1 Tax=Chrysophaeum taylorii TaxID=2483200 RepID=A0AAD7XMV4_9STRA|nr:hypothetical protein CTAYLR_005768 [Chrysophaeum taylorii]